MEDFKIHAQLSFRKEAKIVIVTMTLYNYIRKYG